MRSLIVGVSVLWLGASSARADTFEPSLTLVSTGSARDPWHIDWLSIAGVDDQGPNACPARSLAFPPILLFEQDDPPPPQAAAIEHSDGYQTRAKIHKYSSFAT